jgi:hypothetical protein
MSITLAVALAFIIVSIIITAITNGWMNPLVWIGWAFAMVFIVGPAIGNR